MIFYRLELKDGKVYSNFENLISLNKDTSNSHRNIRHNFSEGAVHLIATDLDANLLGRNKIATVVAKTYLQFVPLLKEVENRQNERYITFAHNLVTTHSRLQDAIGSILPEKQLSKAENHTNQVAIARQAINSNIGNVAESILDIAKRIVDLQAQLEGFKILSGDAVLDIGSHNIKQILQNILHPYYEEFSENNIAIKWHIEDNIAESNKIKTDYKILNVALHHLLNNVVKYAKPYSNLDIFFDVESSELKFKMISVRIENDELKNIFNFGVCGRNVTTDIAGDGVGLYMVQEAMKILNGSVSIHPDYSAKIEDIAGIRYSPNTFILQLSTKK